MNRIISPMIDSITRLVGTIHIGCALFKNIHIILCPSFVIGETIFLTLYTLTPISWIICKDECFISYCIKKINSAWH